MNQIEERVQQQQQTTRQVADVEAGLEASATEAGQLAVHATTAARDQAHGAADFATVDVDGRQAIIRFPVVPRVANLPDQRRRLLLVQGGQPIAVEQAAAFGQIVADDS